MDTYDRLLLRIIATHNQSDKMNRIKLRQLESKFWQEVAARASLRSNEGKLGERVARLYIQGFIENKEGYKLTRRGRNVLDEKVLS